MNGVTRELSPEEIADIERHKYFLSEKAGHDVGWEFAEQDWMEHYGSQEDADGDAQTRSLSAGPLGKLIKRLLSKAAIF